MNTPTKTPLELSREREAKIAASLTELFNRHGITLKQPLQIDANGEFSLVSADKPFGELAPTIAKHRPRYGLTPSNYCEPTAMWCRMNHFDAERMVSL